MASFVKHTNCDDCGSSDGKALYNDGSSHCFVCGKTKPSEEWLEENAEKKPKSKVKSFSRKEDISMSFGESKTAKPIITDEENTAIKAKTSASGNGFRGIRDDVYKYFGVRHSFDEKTGEVTEQYYPVTQEGQISGYKIREVPKNFRSVGRTGADCEMFMAFRFNRGGKYLLITEGEVDSLSAYQMLKDYNSKRGSDFETAVVSPTTGANSQKQIAANYKFFDLFDQVIISYDSDKAGQEAAEKIIPVLPKGKVKIMQMRFKDANEYLEKGKEKEFINDFYAAKSYVPVGVVASNEIYDRMLIQAEQQKISLPPVFHKLNEMLGGGLALGHCYTCSGVTGGGKTSLTNEMIYHWIFNSPYTVGVVSLELSATQYGEALLSRHLQTKLAKMNHEDKIAFLSSDKVRESAKELFEREDGSPRFMLVDDRDSSLEQLQAIIEEMVICSGAKLICIDPWTDCAVDGLTVDEQAVAMKWIKSMIKSHGCAFFLINHVRKAQGGQKDQAAGAMINESDVIGSSTIIKSSSANILLVRDKMNPDPIMRNTTHLYLSKNRLLSETGPAGDIYYDSDTSTLHDLDDWLNNNRI